MIRCMTIIQWMRKHNYSYADVARMLGMRSTSAKMNVCRHARRSNGIRGPTMRKYVSISKGEITLEDLCKPTRRRKPAPQTT
jgi:hypothetical protein